MDEVQAARDKARAEEHVEKALNKNVNVKFILEVWSPPFVCLPSQNLSFCFVVSQDLSLTRQHCVFCVPRVNYDYHLLCFTPVPGCGESGMRSGSK
jgi:hypothetical protein